MTGPSLNIKHVISIAATAILLAVSFPSFNFWPAAWIALIPLLNIIEGSRPGKAFLLSYLTGVLFFFGSIYWLAHVTFPGMIVVVLYLSVYFGLFGAGASIIMDHSSDLAVISVPALWVALEWIRSNILLSFPWVLVAHSQASNLPVIQIADITGAYGVSFLVLCVNTALFVAIKRVIRKDYSTLYVALALFILFLSLSYGVFRLKNIFSGEKFRISVVQGNIPQAKKWDDRYREEILVKYQTLTARAQADDPDLIIWPETSVPGYLESEEPLLARVTEIAKTAGTYLLVGTPRDSGDGTGSYYNSATLITPEGAVSGRYDKIHLVPFGEYIPLKNAFAFIQRFSDTQIGDFSAGKTYSVFSMPVIRTSAGAEVSIRLKKNIRFSTLICFEDIFPEMSRMFVLKGASILINITNDAWFNISSAPYQHVQSSVFRAVENRVNVVRAANTGVSCYIDQKGRVISSVEEMGKRIFVDGYKTDELTINRPLTPYTRYGDLFAYTCLALSAYLLLKSIFKRKAV